METYTVPMLALSSMNSVEGVMDICAETVRADARKIRIKEKTMLRFKKGWCFWWMAASGHDGICLWLPNVVCCRSDRFVDTKKAASIN